MARELVSTGSAQAPKGPRHSRIRLSLCFTGGPLEVHTHNAPRGEEQLAEVAKEPRSSTSLRFRSIEYH